MRRSILFVMKCWMVNSLSRIENAISFRFIFGSIQKMFEIDA